MYIYQCNVEVDKEFEYTVKSIIEVIWGVSCLNTGRGRIIMDLDYFEQEEEAKSVTNLISHLPHVTKVHVE